MSQYLVTYIDYEDILRSCIADLPTKLEHPPGKSWNKDHYDSRWIQ